MLFPYLNIQDQSLLAGFIANTLIHGHQHSTETHLLPSLYTVQKYAKVCKSMQTWHFPTVNQMFNGYWYWLKPEYSGEPENSWKLWIVCPTPKLETIWFLDLFRLYLLNHQLHTEAKPGDHRTKTIWISSTKRPGTDAFFIVFGCGLPQYVDKVTSQRKAFCGRKLDHGPPLGFIVYLSLSCRSGAMLHWRLLLRKHSNHPQKWYRHYCRDL